MTVLRKPVSDIHKCWTQRLHAVSLRAYTNKAATQFSSIIMHLLSLIYCNENRGIWMGCKCLKCFPQYNTKRELGSMHIMKAGGYQQTKAEVHGKEQKKKTNKTATPFHGILIVGGKLYEQIPLRLCAIQRERQWWCFWKSILLAGENTGVSMVWVKPTWTQGVSHLCRNNKDKCIANMLSSTKCFHS